MTKVLVLYYSMYGHIDTLAAAVAEGAKRVDGVEVTVKRVPETMPEEAFKMPVASRISPLLKPRLRSLPTTTQLSSVPPRALATWRAKCVPSSTKPAAYGPGRVAR